MSYTGLNDLAGKMFLTLEDVYGTPLEKGMLITFHPINWNDGIVYIGHYGHHTLFYITYLTVADFVKSTICLDLLRDKELFIYTLSGIPPEGICTHTQLAKK